MDATDGFTGAEIASLVPDALFTAFADGGREIDRDDLLAAATTVVPLSKPPPRRSSGCASGREAGEASHQRRGGWIGLGAPPGARPLETDTRGLLAPSSMETLMVPVYLQSPDPKTRKLRGYASETAREQDIIEGLPRDRALSGSWSTAADAPG